MTKEHDLINRYFAPLCSKPNEAPAFGLLDDTALLQPAKGKEVLVTMDTLVADVHFFANDPAKAIARKALAVNVSDIIAKGGLPHSYLLSLALPKGVSSDWLEAFSSGLSEAQKLYDCELIGGDTVATSGPLVISITLLGEVEKGKMVRRMGARPGDQIYVSGTIGDAALGLLLRLADDRMTRIDFAKAHQDFLLDSYLHPRPILKLAPLWAQYTSAAMDISDGLAGDFAKLCAVSKVGGVIEAAKVPLSDAATSALAQSPGLRETVLTGGDDYQVLATIPADNADEFEKNARNATRIGEILSLEKGVAILDANGIPLDLPHGAFDHFSK
ncbi:MAG: thiamine-phosphate kinase [Hyphomicrobiaceae bacterium]|nr:thiamine-phosphate kinase [Hyphomicrobiaceae bacterium]